MLKKKMTKQKMQKRDQLSDCDGEGKMTESNAERQKSQATSHRVYLERLITLRIVASSLMSLQSESPTSPRFSSIAAAKASISSQQLI